MNLSTLRCELNTEDLAPMDVIAQMGNMKYLWQVFVGDVLLSKRAMPIGPYDDWIELEADREYPIRGDGYRYVFARQTGDFIVWFGTLPSSSFPYARSRGLEDDQ